MIKNNRYIQNPSLYIAVVVMSLGVFFMSAAPLQAASLLNPSVSDNDRRDDREEVSNEDHNNGGEVNGWNTRGLRSEIRGLDDDNVEELPVPILLGVAPEDIADTWGNARSQGRSHKGTDIFAPRGMYVGSATEAVVTGIGHGASRGGNYVFTANPGGETYYYAHLDSIEEGLRRGDILEKGDIIGRVGNSGNARGGVTHLHFAIYTDDGAVNPHPRLVKTFSLEKKIAVLVKIVESLRSELEEA